MISISGFCSRVTPELFFFDSYLVGFLLSHFLLYLRPVRESLGAWLLGASSCPSSWTFLLGLAWIPGEDYL